MLLRQGCIGGIASPCKRGGCGSQLRKPGSRRFFGGQAMYKASRSGKMRFMKSSVEWWKTCKGFALWQACLLSGILLLSSTGFAQLSTASLSGAVRDSSGAVVPDCKVVLKNVATAVEHTTTTNHAGAYLFLNITPGRYVVPASPPPFPTPRIPDSPPPLPHPPPPIF